MMSRMIALGPEWRGPEHGGTFSEGRERKRKMVSRRIHNPRTRGPEALSGSAESGGGAGKKKTGFEKAGGFLFIGLVFRLPALVLGFTSFGRILPICLRVGLALPQPQLLLDFDYGVLAGFASASSGVSGGDSRSSLCRLCPGLLPSPTLPHRFFPTGLSHAMPWYCSPRSHRCSRVSQGLGEIASLTSPPSSTPQGCDRSTFLESNALARSV